MTEFATLENLLNRVRSGDELAVREFVALYEPYIRRAIVNKMARNQFKIDADASDICQSVMGNFVCQLAAGSFSIHSQEDLEKLLQVIVRNKYRRLQRKHGTLKRQSNRVAANADVNQVADDSRADPAKLALKADFLDFVKKHLTAEERMLFDLRSDSHSWEQIADRLGQPTTALRKKLSRAIQRISDMLDSKTKDSI